MKRLLLTLFLAGCAHADEQTLKELLALEHKEAFTKHDQPAAEQVKAMVNRFKEYKAKAQTQDKAKALSDCFKRAGKRIIERARKKVEEAEDELEQKTTKSAPSVRT